MNDIVLYSAICGPEYILIPEQTPHPYKENKVEVINGETVRYCEYPGHRIFKSITVEMDGVPIQKMYGTLKDMLSGMIDDGRVGDASWKLIHMELYSFNKPELKQELKEICDYLKEKYANKVDILEKLNLDKINHTVSEVFGGWHDLKGQ